MYPLLPVEPAAAMQFVAALFTIFSALISLVFLRPY
jgi:hypothetical protein